MPVIPAPAAPTHDLDTTHFTSLATPSTGSGEASVWRVHECWAAAMPCRRSPIHEPCGVVCLGIASLRAFQAWRAGWFRASRAAVRRTEVNSRFFSHIPRRSVAFQAGT